MQTEINVQDEMFFTNRVQHPLAIKACVCTLSNCARLSSKGMPRLNAIERERAIGRLQAGDRPSIVANALGVAVSTICRLWSRFEEAGGTQDGARSGRPRATAGQADLPRAPASAVCSCSRDCSRHCRETRCSHQPVDCEAPPP